MVRDQRRAQAEHLAHIAHAVLAVAEDLEDASPVRLGQGSEPRERVDREQRFRLVVVQRVHAAILIVL